MFLSHAVQQPPDGQELDDDEADEALGTDEGAVYREGLDDGGHALRGVGGEEDYAGNEVAEEASGKAQEDAQIKAVFHESGQSDSHEGQGIVENNLHRMQDEGIQQEVHEAVEEACHGTNRGAEAIGDEHDGQHGAQGQAAALGEVEQA